MSPAWQVRNKFADGPFLSDETLVDDETVVAQRKRILHNLELMTWMPVHAALLYTTVRLVSDAPKDRLSVVIVVVVASLLASSMASIAIKRAASCPDDDRPYGFPVRASDRVLAVLPFGLFFTSLALIMTHLLHR